MGPQGIARTVIVLALSAAMSGCYLVHERPTDAAFDGSFADGAVSTHDAALDTIAMDAGLDPTHDAAIDTNLMPTDPDPDLGADARPSDYVDAGDWSDAPMLGPSDPCCTLGDPVHIVGDDDGVALAHQAPAIAWGPGYWGLLATELFFRPDLNDYDPHPVVFELEANGTPRGDLHELSLPSDRIGHIAWAEGRWAVSAIATATPGQWSVATLDAALQPASAWMNAGPAPGDLGVALAWVTTGHRWEAIGGVGSLTVTPFTDTGVELPITQAPDVGRGVVATGLRSRVAVLISHSDPTPSEVVTIGAPPDYAVLSRVALRANYSEETAIAALRDVAVVVGIDGTDVHAEVVDPFAGTAIGAVASIGQGVLTLDSSLDVIGSSKLGVAGVCWVAETVLGTPDTISTVDFRLIGQDGSLQGAPVPVIQMPFRAGEANCSVGTDELGFLVAWWSGSDLWVRRVFVAD